MPVLVGRRLEERDGGKVTRARRLPEPREIVEMLGLVGLAHHRHRRGRQVERVGRRREVLKRVVVRHVVLEAERIGPGVHPDGPIERFQRMAL